MVFNSNPATRYLLTKFAHWLGSGSGIVILAHIVIDELERAGEERERHQRVLEEFCEEEELLTFPQVLVTPTFDMGVQHILQCSGIGPIAPNLVMLGWPAGVSSPEGYVHSIQQINSLGKSIVLLKTPDNWELPHRSVNKRIDIWWRGEQNGSLIAILAWLLSLDRVWTRSTIRFLRRVDSEAGERLAQKDLSRLIEAARLDATSKIIIDKDADFNTIFHRESSDASAVFMGFAIPEKDGAENFLARGDELTKEMPPLFFVNSTGEADLFV